VQHTVYKSGSSLVVVVPSEFASVVGVKSGDSVKVSVDYDRGQVTYLFSGASQLSLIKSKKSKARSKK
jgi:antitoxin component of MazEF toxin-antitoxin module